MLALRHLSRGDLALQVPAQPLGYLPDHLAADRADPKEIATNGVSRHIGGDLGAEIHAAHVATTRLAAIEKAANRFRAKEARFGSTAVASALAAAIVSGEAASERDAMMSLANCRCGAALALGLGGASRYIEPWLKIVLPLYWIPT